jgi:hypothetical protein
MFRNPSLKSSRILLLIARELCSQMQVLVGMNIWYVSSPSPRQNPGFQIPGLPPPVPAPIGVTFYTSSVFSVYFASSGLLPPGDLIGHLVTPLAFYVV